MKYTIIFEDGIKYESPDIRENDPGWNTELNGKKTSIKEIRVALSNDNVLVLQGFEKYNFFVLASQSINGSKPTAEIESFFFCGAKKGIVVVWELNIKDKKIIKRLVKDGQEYMGYPTRGWRPGIFGKNARSGVCSI